jgi:hypothetical protein
VQIAEKIRALQEWVAKIGREAEQITEVQVSKGDR